MRTAVKILIVIVALAATAWMGTFFYWHFRIAREIRILRTQTTTSPIYSDVTPEQHAAASNLMGFGCRALPRLIGTLHPSEHAGFLNAASYTIAAEAGWFDWRPDQETWDKQKARITEWSILPDDSDATKRRKIVLMQEWWLAHAREHPWWRVWSSRCR